jgi:hypothetical protein
MIGADIRYISCAQYKIGEFSFSVLFPVFLSFYFYFLLLFVSYLILEFILLLVYLKIILILLPVGDIPERQ